MSPARAKQLTVGQIAQLAGVRPSAVSNWRLRHADFPRPVDETTSGALFDQRAVEEWLTRRGRGVVEGANIPESRAWEAVEALRDALGLDEAVLVVLQLLFIRSALAELHPSISDWRRIAQAKSDAMLRDAWQDAISKVANVRPAQREDDARALELAAGASLAAMQRAVKLLSEVSTPQGGWGDIATRILQRLQASSLKGMPGQSTSEGLTELMVELLQPINGTLYDPATGPAMVLAESWRRRGERDLRLYGQEVNQYGWRIGHLHLALCGAQFALEAGDTLRDDRFGSLRFDRITLETPLGARVSPSDYFVDHRFRLGVVPQAEWLWAQHVTHHLSEKGMGVMTIPSAALARTGAEASIRLGLVQEDCLDAVVELAPGFAQGISISLSLLLFDRNRHNRQQRVLFIDARRLGQSRRGQPRSVGAADINRIVGAIRQWRHGVVQEEPLFSAVGTPEQIKNFGGDLSPHRYVRYVGSVEELKPSVLEARLAESLKQIAAAQRQSKDLLEMMAGSVRSLVPHETAAWPLVRLGDLLLMSPVTGVRQDEEADGAGIPYVTTAQVTGGKTKLTSVPEQVTRQSRPGRIARRNDLLLASRGIDEQSRIWAATVEFEHDVAYAESLMKLTPNTSRILPDFLRLYLTSRQGRMALAAATTGSVIANLRPSALEEVELRVPPLDVQHRIVSLALPVEQAAIGLGEVTRLAQDTLDMLRDGLAEGRIAPIVE